MLIAQLKTLRLNAGAGRRLAATQFRDMSHEVIAFNRRGPGVFKMAMANDRDEAVTKLRLQLQGFYKTSINQRMFPYLEFQVVTTLVEDSGLVSEMFRDDAGTDWYPVLDLT